MSCTCATKGIVEGDIRFEEKDVGLFFDVRLKSNESLNSTNGNSSSKTYGTSVQRDEFLQEGADNTVRLWNYKDTRYHITVPYVMNITCKLNCIG